MSGQQKNENCVQAQYRNDAGSIFVQASACSIRVGMCANLLPCLIIVLLLTWYQVVLHDLVYLESK